MSLTPMPPSVLPTGWIGYDGKQHLVVYQTRKPDNGRDKPVTACGVLVWQRDLDVDRTSRRCQPCRRADRRRRADRDKREAAAVAERRLSW